MKQKLAKRVLAALLSGMIAATAFASALPVHAAYTPDTRSDNIISLFQNPDSDSKPMLRYWIPDAGASYDELKNEMTDMAQSGFGGVEISFVPHFTQFDNSEYGFGSENWISLMKNVLKIAKSIDGGFKVDFTVTAHWPASLNTIDPNDAEASKELVNAYQKITDPSAIADIPMPTITTKDKANNPFIFVNEFVAATVAQVKEVDADGNYILDESTMQTIDTYRSAKTTAAGIPQISEDDPSAEYVKGLYGGTLPDASAFFEDSAGNPVSLPNRTPLADTQYYYRADLSQLGLTDYTPSEGEGLQAGDWVLYGFYQRGTGQSLGGSFMTFQEPMPAITYALDLFSKAGSQKLIDYWETVLLEDSELRTLLKESGADIFEDSLETNFDKGSVFWYSDMLQEFKAENGYDLTAYLPAVAAGPYTQSGMGPGAPSTKVAGFTVEGENYSSDYDQMIDLAYMDNHIEVLKNYFNKSFNCGYRAQAYHTNGITLDTSAASARLDVAETESLAWSTDYDRFRAVAGGVHLAGKKYVSEEALANMSDTYKLTWESAVSTINTNFAAGVNRMIIHGSSYASTNAFAEEYDQWNQWPGWHAFNSMFADPWGSRMAYWDRVDTMTGYIARNQAVLQNGTPQMDLLVYDLNTFEQTPVGNGDNDKSTFYTLLDNGYTYDITTTEALLLDSSVVSDGVLCADGASYKAVVVNNMEAIPLEGAQRLLSYAQAGLPILFVGQQPGKAMSETVTDEQIQAIVAEILATGSATVVADQDAALAQLRTDGITPNAEYTQYNLRTVNRVDSDGTSYYFVFNNSSEDVAVPVSFTGSGIPYSLNAWTGEIAPVAQYTTDSKTVSTVINLGAGETTILAITKDTTNFPAAPELHITSTDAKAMYQNGKPAIRSDESGSYTSVLSDGTTVTSELTVAEPVAIESAALSIESWGPDAEANKINPTISKKTMIEVGETSLDTWSNLAVSQDKLDAAGVSAMKEVSGIGTYTMKVTLGQMDGAVLSLTHGKDMITDITVNRHALGNLDQTVPRYDVGAYLQEGENIITVSIATTMNNRAVVENSNLGGGGFPGGGSQDKSQAYGLTSAVLLPYAQQTLVQEEQADKTILKSVIDYANQAKSTEEYANVIDSVKVSFDGALAHAEQVYADSAVTQSDVDSAWMELLNEVHKLGFQKGDKSQLSFLITRAEGIDLTLYVQAGQAEFTAALAEAKEILGDGEAMQGDVDTAVDNLLAAMLDLRFKADKSILETTLAATAVADLSGYTPETVAAYNTARAEADALLADETVSEDDQAAVNAAADKLEMAYRGLTKAIPVAGDTSVQTSASTPKTGETLPISLAVGLLLAGAAVVGTTRKKQK